MSQLSDISGPRPVRLRIEDYELLLKSGALAGYPHVELVEGVIIAMNAGRTRHGRVKNELTFRLHAALRALGSDLAAYCEATISLPPYSLPEPDVIVVRDVAADDAYHAGADVRIVIEVADATAAEDLRFKYELYGRHGIPEYWVVDLKAGMLHQFFAPAAAGYGESRSVPLGEAITAETIPGLRIDTAGLG